MEPFVAAIPGAPYPPQACTAPSETGHVSEVPSRVRWQEASVLAVPIVADEFAGIAPSSTMLSRLLTMLSFLSIQIPFRFVKRFLHVTKSVRKQTLPFDHLAILAEVLKMPDSILVDQ